MSSAGQLVHDADPALHLRRRQRLHVAAGHRHRGRRGELGDELGVVGVHVDPQRRRRRRAPSRPRPGSRRARRRRPPCRRSSALPGAKSRAASGPILTRFLELAITECSATELSGAGPHAIPHARDRHLGRGPGTEQGAPQWPSSTPSPRTRHPEHLRARRRRHLPRHPQGHPGRPLRPHRHRRPHRPLLPGRRRRPRPAPRPERGPARDPRRARGHAPGPGDDRAAARPLRHDRARPRGAGGSPRRPAGLGP